MKVLLNDIKRVYFIGIGGIGMSALARYFRAQGKLVSGYDKTSTELSRQLESEGIRIHYNDSIEELDTNADVVIYTPAIPADHKGLQYFRQSSTPLIKRSEALGMISQSAYTVAIAGSHGKTTVSSMVAHIFHEAKLPFTAFLGGIAVNYNSNYISLGNEVVVVEADEYDRSFHRLSPDVALITSVDSDHLDIYGTQEQVEEAFVEFSRKIRKNGFLICNASAPCYDRMHADHKFSYSASEEADISLQSRRIERSHYRFTIQSDGILSEFELGIGGIHNVENAIAAIAIARQMKITDEQINRALISFAGVKRRFEKRLSTEHCTYIDDYAHHPREIDALLSSCRELYPGKKILGVFQPHLFSRSRDLAVEFGESLSQLDELILLPIYPAREKAIAGVSSELILQEVKGIPAAVHEKEQLLEVISNSSFDLLLTIGAGDIDTLVQPLTDMLKAR